MLSNFPNILIRKRKLILSFAVLFCLFSSVSLTSFKQAQALTVTPKVEIDANPGTVVYPEIKVTNEERETRTFYIRAENFNAQDETGNPTFTTRQEDLAVWIKTQPSITLGPGESIILPVEIDIPYNADPGGHYAALFFLTQPPSLDGTEQELALSAKLGSLILLRVNGKFNSDANILEFGTTGKQKFFTQLPVQFYYRFQNTGDDHTKPIGDVVIKNFLGRTAKILEANPVAGSVLPKSVRQFFTTWTDRGGDQKQKPVIDLPKADAMSYWDSVKYQAKHFMIGRYNAQLKIAFGTKTLKTDHAEFTFYVIPWQLLSIIIPGLIIILCFLRFVLRRYNRYIISRARQNL